MLPAERRASIKPSALKIAKKSTIDAAITINATIPALIYFPSILFLIICFLSVVNFYYLFKIKICRCS